MEVSTNISKALKLLSNNNRYFPFFLAFIYSSTSIWGCCAWLVISNPRECLIEGVFFESADVYFKMTFLFGAIIPTYFQVYLKQRKGFNRDHFLDFFLYTFLVNLRFFMLVGFILSIFAFINDHPLSMYLVKMGLCSPSLAPSLFPIIIVCFLIGVPFWRVATLELNLNGKASFILGFESLLLIIGFTSFTIRFYLYNQINPFDCIIPYSAFYVIMGTSLLVLGICNRLFRNTTSLKWDYSIKLLLISLLRAPLVLFRLFFLTTIRNMYPSSISSFPSSLSQLQIVQEPYLISIFSNLHVLRAVETSDERRFLRRHLANTYLFSWPTVLFFIFSNAISISHYYKNPISLMEAIGLYVISIIAFTCQRMIVYIKCLPVFPNLKESVIEAIWSILLMLGVIYTGQWGTLTIAWGILISAILSSFSLLHFLQNKYENIQTF